MPDNNKPQKNTQMNNTIAAALIMIAIFLTLLFVPMLIQWIAKYNEWLAYTVGALTILAFFAVFWLRARYQQKRDGE